MPCDNELVECVGRDNMVKICKQIGCPLYIACFPRNGHIEICAECYAEVEKQYPDRVAED